ncbi:GNAT family N-acetyltransferase [Shimia sp. CNT1-13L.2]|uniref:GNAT family N-acetyltransferase n=1 Tax=Shimia sp. CNT1-13L.2 TaxID=2959663 RepID=UPI0020CE703D|nr:GNAT family N-acetyltransferase [Shimia sp. CNT1-13L.2]MCP9480540.1 GNAT family N-acetyltransferase [Shimia sp. CNT1-13L.2]
MTPAQLAALHAAAFTQSRPWSEQEFADLLASPFCFVVGDTTGFALGRVIAGEAELLTIATHPDVRRQGRGRHWLTAFETQAQTLAATEAFLEVAADNAPAIALYQSAGYEDRAIRSGYYQRPDGSRIDARVMGKRLP